MTSTVSLASHLHILHKSRDQGGLLGGALQSSLPVWQTCLREIALSSPQQIRQLNSNFSPLLQSSPVDQYQGLQATQFLLEVICGLHSPVKAETEVHGQFRQFYRSCNEGLTQISPLHPKICERLDRMANDIRDRFLRGLGSQSYGSYARKKIRGLDAVHIIGSGHLAKEILPWVIKSAPHVHVYYRNIERAKELMERFPTAQFHPLYEQQHLITGALLITAPLSAEQIHKWLGKNWHQLSCILDYRSESSFDGLRTHAGLMSLKDVFMEIEVSKQLADEKVARAKFEIEKIACSL